MNILDTIMQERREAVAAAKRTVPVELLKELAAGRTHHSLAEALRQPGHTSIIAEMKKASPSAGLLRETYEPANIARMYEDNGAAAISVLTEPLHFHGSDQHLRVAREAVSIPILKKDFMCDPYQVYEAAACGADAILIIIAALDPATVDEIYKTAADCRLDVLAESHNAEELDRALALPDVIIGVNSRNLKTLETHLATALELAMNIPDDRVSVAESGIRTRRDIEGLAAQGFDGFLIGETLMAADDPAHALRTLRGEEGKA